MPNNTSEMENQNDPNYQRKLDNTRKIERLIKEKNYSKLTREYFPEFYKRYNEYEFMLNKCQARYYQNKFANNQKRYAFFLVLSLGGFVVYKAIKAYYIAYYYIMYEVDIRKPRVSDFILTRYR